MKDLKTIFLCSALLLCCLSLSANNKKSNDSLFVPHKNIVKVRVIAGIYSLATIAVENSKLFGASYERVIKPKHTIGVYFDYMNSKWSREYPSADGYYHITQHNKTVQFQIRPEYRYYFNRKNIYPRGIHIGLMGLLASGKENIDVLYITAVSSQDKTSNAVTRDLICGIGPSAGIQYFLGKKKRFVINASVAMYYTRIVKRTKNGRKYPSSFFPAPEWSGDAIGSLGYTF
jgi:hypothetical protein